MQFKRKLFFTTFFLIFTIVLLALGWWSENAVRFTLQDQLKSVFENNLREYDKNIEVWTDTQLDHLQNWVDDPEFYAELHEYLNKANRDDFEIKASDEKNLIDIRFHLVNKIVQHHYTDFVLFNDYGVIVGAMHEGVIGSDYLFQQYNFVKHALDGVANISKPIPSEIAYTASSQLSKDENNIFLTVPIRDVNGSVMGALGVRVNHSWLLNYLFDSLWFGKTGETYFVSDIGVFLSTVRRSSSHEYEKALSIGDTKLLSDFVKRKDENTYVYTESARALMSQQDGMNLAGYLNYDNQEVIGAWRWLDKFKVGVVQEVEITEAYSALSYLYVVNRTLYGVLGCFFIMLLIMAGYRLKEETMTLAYQTLLPAVFALLVIAVSLSLIGYNVLNLREGWASKRRLRA